MKALQDYIRESILDDDESISKDLGNKVIIGALLNTDCGIYFANSKNCQRLHDEVLVHIERGDTLVFTDEKNKEATSVILDHSKAKSFLKKNGIKNIVAPTIHILRAEEDLGGITYKTHRLAIITDNAHIKNLDFIHGTDLWFNYTFLYEPYHMPRIHEDAANISFVNPVNNTKMTSGKVLIRSSQETKMTNCSMIKENRSETLMLDLDTSGLFMNNVSGDIDDIYVYDNSLFELKYSPFANRLNSIIDQKYTFVCTDKRKNSTIIRKADLMRTVAYFRNKNYVQPKTPPFKIIGSLKDVIGDYSKLKNLNTIRFSDNNVAIKFNKNRREVERSLQWNKVNYDKGTLDIEKTTDGFYVGFYLR